MVRFLKSATEHECKTTSLHDLNLKATFSVNLRKGRGGMGKEQFVADKSPLFNPWVKGPFFKVRQLEA